MRRIISVELEYPDCSTSNLREKMGNVLRDVLKTEIYDLWDSGDDRMERAQEEVKSSTLSSYRTGIN